MEKIILSTLPHTWFLDLDGTIVKHNGYKIDGRDTFLRGAREFLRKIPENDKVIFTTSRSVDFKDITESFLKVNGIKFDQIIYGLPMGERILINDRKPSGLSMALAIDINRDSDWDIDYEMDEEL